MGGLRPPTGRRSTPTLAFSMTGLYDVIGSTYGTSRRADPALVHSLASHLELSKIGKYLDVACGTGSYTVALSSLGGTWHGVDVSARMWTRPATGVTPSRGCRRTPQRCLSRRACSMERSVPSRSIILKIWTGPSQKSRGFFGPGRL